MKTVIRALAAIAAFVIFGNAQAQLTPGNPISTGTAEALTPAVAGIIQQGLFGTTSYGSANWTLNGGGLTVTPQSQSYSIEFGTVPELLTSTNGNTSYLSQGARVSPANGISIASAYFSVQQAGVPITNASTSVTLALTQSQGIALYSVTFNPATGQVLSSVGTGVVANIQPFSAYDGVVAGKINRWYRVAVAGRNTAAVNSVTGIRIYPSGTSTATTYSVLSYGPQVELLAGTNSATNPVTAQPSAFVLVPPCVASPVCTENLANFSKRAPGRVPRQSSLNTRDAYNLITGATVYSPSMAGTTLLTSYQGGSLQITSPFSVAPYFTNGEWFTIVNFDDSTLGGTNFTVSTSASYPFYYPPSNLMSTAGATSYTVLPGYAVTFTYVTAAINGGGGSGNPGWIVTSSYAGATPYIPTAGAAGTILRSDGTNWAVSQDTWPDLIASGNVLYATAANTVGSNAGFKSNGTQILMNDGTAALPAYAFTNNTGTGFNLNSSANIFASVNGTTTIAITSGTTTGFVNHSTLPYSWGSSGVGTPDLLLYRDAANTLAQRNGTTAQTHRIYNTYANSGTDYENLIIEWASNNAKIYTGKGGTGSARNLQFGVSNSTQWQLNSSGHFIPVTTNANDIGASGTVVRNTYSAKYFTGGTAPTMGACGTSPSVVGGDSGMTVTVGTGGAATTCAVTFSSTFTNAPACVVNSDTDLAALTVTTTATTVTVTKAAAFTASSKLHILCIGR